MQRRARQMRDRGLQGAEAIVQRQERVTPKRDDRRLLGLVRAVERGSFGPVLRSSTVSRLRHFATVLGFVGKTIHGIVF